MKSIDEIAFVDLRSQCNDLVDEVMPAVEQVIRQAHFVFGEEVGRFEDRFAEFCGAAHCIGVASGTDALHLALRQLGVGPGDEVITSANSFAATAFAIAYTGAEPVFVDVSPNDCNLDPELLEQAVSSRTKAIVPVHLYGQPAEMDAIRKFAGQHGLAIVEDACQAHGAKYQGESAGTMGQAGCFSFYPGKNLGAFGDGGAIVTDDPDLAGQLKLARNYGQRVKNEHSMLGFNSRLDTIQAAILLVKLAYLDRWNDQRRQAAAWYREVLADRAPTLELMSEKPNCEHVYHLFVVRHDDRDGLMAHLADRGIQCGIHYPIPLCHAAPFKHHRSIPAGAPVATRLAGRILSLPMHPGLDYDQVVAVADQIAVFEPSPATG